MFVEMQGTYIDTFDGNPTTSVSPTVTAPSPRTVTIGSNGRIGHAGVVEDVGNGSVTITNLTIAGKVLDFK